MTTLPFTVVAKGELSSSKHGVQNLSPSSSTTNDLASSLLPPVVEAQFTLLHELLNDVGCTMDKLETLCPLIRKTPKLRELAESVEVCRSDARAQIRALHDKLRVPFRITEIVTHLEPDDPDRATVLARDGSGGPITVKGLVPQLVGKKPKIPMDPFSAYQLTVTHNENSDFSKWHMPYRVVFTPDPNWGDMNTGAAVPAISVDVDGSGRVTCAHGKLPGAEEDVANSENVRIDYAADASSVNVLLAPPSFEPIDILSISASKKTPQRTLAKGKGRARDELEATCLSPARNIDEATENSHSTSTTSKVSTVPFPVVSPVKDPASNGCAPDHLSSATHNPKDSSAGRTPEISAGDHSDTQHSQYVARRAEASTPKASRPPRRSTRAVALNKRKQGDTRLDENEGDESLMGRAGRPKRRKL